MKLTVRRGLRHWYWVCFACSEGFAKGDWRAAFDSALEHAGKPEHIAVSKRRAVKVRRDPAWRTWKWSCSVCGTGATSGLFTPWDLVLDGADRHARQDWHREKVARGGH